MSLANVEGIKSIICFSVFKVISHELTHCSFLIFLIRQKGYCFLLQVKKLRVREVKDFGKNTRKLGSHGVWTRLPCLPECQPWSHLAFLVGCTSAMPFVLWSVRNFLTWAKNSESFQITFKVEHCPSNDTVKMNEYKSSQVFKCSLLDMGWFKLGASIELVDTWGTEEMKLNTDKIQYSWEMVRATGSWYRRR